MKRTGLFIILLAAVLALSACGGGGLDGRWQLTAASKAALLDKLLGGGSYPALDGYDFFFVFNHGEFYITYHADEKPESTSRYTVNGNTFTYDDGHSYSFSVKGNELEIYGYFDIPVLTMRRLAD